LIDPQYSEDGPRALSVAVRSRRGRLAMVCHSRAGGLLLPARRWPCCPPPPHCACEHGNMCLFISSLKR
jgi:hypothetical protein